MRKAFFYGLPIILFIIALFSIDSWSLWCDESTTAFLASSNNLADLKINLFKFGSETQMPGWVFFMWFWVKLFGMSEFVLRSSNLLFIGLLFLYYLYIQIRAEVDKKDKNIFAISLVLSVINPFILYNLNEARSNIAVFCLCFISIMALELYFKYNKRSDWFIFCISIVLAFAFNMLSGFLIPVCLYLLYRSKIQIGVFWKKNSITLVTLFVIFGTLVIYYLYTLFINKGGAKETPGIGNIGYVFYDFLGFSGLGPDKNTLRESSNKTLLLLQYLPQLSILLLYYILEIIFVLKIFKTKLFSNINLQSFLLGFLFFFIVAYFIKFRFWSRHLLFIYPIFLLFMSEVIYAFFIDSKKAIKFVPIICLSILMLSSYNIVFNPKHKKENISEAISKCNSIRNPNEKVIFTEASTLAWYYKLDNYSNLNSEPNQKGLLVWFKRNAVLGDQNQLYQNLINKSTVNQLFENKDYKIMRIE